MMLHQDGSTNEWKPGMQWDLMLTMDDATNLGEEGTSSSFRGVKEVIEKRGLFSSLCTDGGSLYWLTPQAGGKVDKVKLSLGGR